MSFALLGLLVFLAGFVDALAGGGGLITLPAYMASGLDPALILGTNKLSSCIGTVVSTARYLRTGRFEVKPFIPVIVASLLGSALGARLVLLMDPAYLRYLLLAALPLVSYVVWSKHDFGAADRRHHFKPGEVLTRSVLIALPIGCYDGFFGPGTGTFFTMALSSACGYDLLGATTGAKILNLMSNASALATFLIAGRVDLRLGAAMGALSLAGHYAGAGVGIKKGAKAIRPMIVLVCAGLFLKLLLDSF